MICALCGDRLYFDHGDVVLTAEGSAHFDCAEEATTEEGWLPFHRSQDVRPVHTVAWL